MVAFFERQMQQRAKLVPPSPRHELQILTRQLPARSRVEQAHPNLGPVFGAFEGHRDNVAHAQ